MKTIIKLLILVSLIGIAYNAQCQEQDYIVELKTPLIQIKNYGVNCSEVIDKRIDKSNLGRVFKGRTDKTRGANFPGDFTEYFKNRLESLLERKEGNIDLVFIIHKLQVNEEKLDLEKYGHCYLEIEFAKRIDSDLFSLGIFESKIVKEAIDVNGTTGKRILKNLEICLKTLDKTDLKNKKGVLLNIEDPKYTYNYMEIPKIGLYLNFGQLARNIPLPNTKFSLNKIHKTHKKQRYTCDTNRKDLINMISYISDGKDLYIRLGDLLGSPRFLKAKQYGKYIYFELKQSGTKGRAYILDTGNNEVKLFDRYTLLNLTKIDFPEILKEFKKSKKKLSDLEKAIVKLNDKYVR
ncbi:MAG: hypothetical protein AB8F74_23345 [Saprospiraceae bacterium]